MTKFKYNIIVYDITKDKLEEEPWTGTFENEQAADQWYENFGETIWKEKKLVRRVVN